MPTYRNDGEVSHKVIGSDDIAISVLPSGVVRTLENPNISDFTEIATIPSNEITIDTAPGANLAIGTTKPNVANSAFDYNIDGRVYKKAANAVGTPLSGDNVPQNKYGAWRLEIGIDGTVDVIQATDNATGYDSSALALAGLPTLSSGHKSMGTVTAIKTDGAFQPGTTNLDDGNTTVVYTDGDLGGVFTDPVKPNSNGYLNYSISGDAWTGTVSLQRSFDNGTNWFDYLESNSNQEKSITDFELGKLGVLYRIGMKHSNYDSGSVTVRLSK